MASHARLPRSGCRSGAGRVQPRPGLVRPCGRTARCTPSAAAAGWSPGCRAIGPDAGALWVCAALGDGDREAVAAPGGRLTGRRRRPAVRMLDIAGRRASPTRTTASRTRCSGSSTTCCTRPRWSRSSTRSSGAQWAAYETYNRAFAEALAEEAAEGAAVLVQDYHLALVPGLLRELPPRPAHRPLLAHPVGAAGLLPAAARRRRRAGAARHARRRPGRLPHPALGGRVRRLLRGVLGAEVAGAALGHTRAHDRIGVHGLGADADFLRERSHEAGRRRADGGAARGRSAPGRKTIVRVDRTELSKNIVRGLLAYRQLLRRPPRVARAGGARRLRLPLPAGPAGVERRDHAHARVVREPARLLHPARHVHHHRLRVVVALRVRRAADAIARDLSCCASRAAAPPTPLPFSTSTRDVRARAQRHGRRRARRAVHERRVVRRRGRRASSQLQRDGSARAGLRRSRSARRARAPRARRRRASRCATGTARGVARACSTARSWFAPRVTHSCTQLHVLARPSSSERSGAPAEVALRERTVEHASLQLAEPRLGECSARARCPSRAGSRRTARATDVSTPVPTL